MMKTIDIVDDDDNNNDDDDMSIIYSTPKSSKGKENFLIETISVENNYMFSKPSSSGTKKVLIDLSEVHDDNFTYDICIDEKSTSDVEFLGTRFVRNSVVVIDDDDEVDDIFTCDICVDEKSTSEIFKIMGCTHSYCKECIAKYVGSKIQENISMILCPVLGCNGVLEPYNCRSILPKNVFDRWGDVLCEAMILGSEKFYCPFKDCSALFTIDENACVGSGDGYVVTQSECPECRRLFCAKCKVVWHSGIMCEEFQKLNKDEREREDIQLMQLAKGQQWQRCPRCRMYVVRSDGCAQMRCRCGCYFCYKCGDESNNHYCKSCGT
ncbi:unnamed protein product [Withania somnifera]